MFEKYLPWTYGKFHEKTYLVDSTLILVLQNLFQTYFVESCNQPCENNPGIYV